MIHGPSSANANVEIKFLYIKKASLNITLFQTHLKLAKEWGNTWHISNYIQWTLENETENK